ncbi:hypothetical protein SUDANB148_04412 [Streptomyces sp. SudanB148_2056]
MSANEFTENKENGTVNGVPSDARNGAPSDTENGAPSDTGSGVGSKDSSGAGRAVVLVAAVLLLACAGLVGYGLLDTEEEPGKPSTPTAAVTYEVTGDGTAEISFLGRNEDGTATVVRDAELPWKRTVRVPLGMAPTVAIVLGEKGGQASCTLAVRGKHVQRATAMGAFGRATCAGALPADGN